MEKVYKSIDEHGMQYFINVNVQDSNQPCDIDLDKGFRPHSSRELAALPEDLHKLIIGSIDAIAGTPSTPDLPGWKVIHVARCIYPDREGNEIIKYFEAYVQYSGGFFKYRIRCENNKPKKVELSRLKSIY